MSADDVTHSLPVEPGPACLVRDGDGEIWQRANAGPYAGWVMLLPVPGCTAPWHKLAPHVAAVLVPLPGLVPSDGEVR